MKLDRFKKGFRGMKKDLLKIIEHFGVNNQQRKLQEEVFELQEAIMEYRYDENKIYPEVEECLKGHIAEEIADICVILRQFMEHYDITQDEISDRMADKINRTLERIESGYYEK